MSRTREEQLAEAHDPRFCGQVKKVAPYLGGVMICGLLAARTSYPESNIACYPARCPIKTKWDFDTTGALVRYIADTIDKRVRGSCWFCGNSKHLSDEPHEDWCPLAELKRRFEVSGDDAFEDRPDDSDNFQDCPDEALVEAPEGV